MNGQSRSPGIRTYLVIFERGKDRGWGAYAPDLPGLGVGVETREEGIRVYLEELRADGLPIPEPTTTAERITVAA